MQLLLGDRAYDVTHRALVMGILNRTKDSFFDHGAYWDSDKFFRRAETLVAEGADLLDIGGVKAGVGDEVTVEEEIDRVGGAISELRRRFDVPLSVDTWRAPALEAALRAGAVLGNDISGFGDPQYLPTAARHGAGVVATHIRLKPRVYDPDPHYDDVVGVVHDFLAERVEMALAAGIQRSRILADPGPDLGKTPDQSATLLVNLRRLEDLGVPVFLAVSNKDFVGEIFDLPMDQRRAPGNLAALSVGITLGARMVRVHDVAQARRVVDTLAALSSGQMPGSGGTEESSGSEGAPGAQQVKG